MKEQQHLFLSTIIFFAIVVLSIAQLVISNKLTTDSVELSKLEKETNLYREKNAVLEEELISEMSLTKIASSAAELGFVKINDVLSISSEIGIAKLP